MQNKIILIVVLFVLCDKFLFAQSNESKGKLSTTTLVNVEVMKVFPGELSQVALIFRAETPDGEPVWDLKKEDLIVQEDSLSCEIVSLEPISKVKPISVGVVIDHSGSMGTDLFSYLDIVGLIFGNRDTIIPLEHAKRSAKIFVSSFNVQKDYFSVVAFGSSVDLKISLNQDTAKTNKKIEAIKVDGGTALYDGMIEGMKQLKQADGVKVLVALTDGMENASKVSWQDVVNYSLKENIPIYVVGLGFVSKDTLSSMAKATKGQFFHTNKSSSLVDIYKKISKQIQSFYSVEYKTRSVSKLKTEEQVRLSFDVKSIYLANDSTDPEVAIYIKEKEFDRKVKTYGRIAAYTVAGVGVVTLYYIYRRKRRRRKMSIVGNNLK